MRPQRVFFSWFPIPPAHIIASSAEGDKFSVYKPLHRFQLVNGQAAAMRVK
jgi:hypothetical protein